MWGSPWDRTVSSASCNAQALGFGGQEAILAGLVSRRGCELVLGKSSIVQGEERKSRAEGLGRQLLGG